MISAWSQFLLTHPIQQPMTMQHQPFHRGPFDLEAKDWHSYPTQYSVHPPTNQQLPAARGPHRLPVYSNQQTELDPSFASILQETPGPAVWPAPMTAGPVCYQVALAQPTTDAPPMSDASPSVSSDHSGHITGNNNNFVAALELPLQGLEGRESGWIAYSPPTGQSPLPAFAENGPDDARVFRCKWQGCRSYTSFRRETDLLRHLRTVHVSPKAYPCPEPNCDKGFGRKDHLRTHQRNCHGA
ncbi:uncharacterized protein BJX67DRAFT_365887 [Aspergillus lucknowensis]|uniref:C2H2-type domain-containing protein n=1 Tax=Aspergillus lucknowensis TaxID=176173 RepID=A0ABR4LEU9_9EURO